MPANFHTLAQVASARGLTMDPKEQSVFESRATLRGVVEGRVVELHQWAGDFLHVEVYAHFSWPGDLGLALAPAGFASKLGELLGWHDVQVGDAAFDDAFVLRAVDQERARQLCTPAVRAALLRWKNAGVDFTVSDDGVALWLAAVPLYVGGPLSTKEVHTPEELLANLDAACALARVLDEALQSLPPSPALAKQAQALEAYAREHRLTFRASPLGLEGTLGTDYLAVHLLVQHEVARFAVSLRFAEPLADYLRVAPVGSLGLLARLRSPGHRETTGDAAFDERFYVFAAHPDTVRKRLTEPVRKALLALHGELGPVELDAQRLTLLAPPDADPASFGLLFDRLLALETALRLG